MKLVQLVVVCVASIVVSEAALAAGAGNDRDFITKAIKGDNSEIMLGSVAQQRGATPDMRAFGAMLVADHTKARDQAITVAHDLGVSPPSGAMAEADVERAKVALLSGPSFDREFANYMVNDHRHDIADFEAEAAQGHGAAAALARKSLPVLRKHLSAAERLAAHHG
jgi:putative membrane protein